MTDRLPLVLIGGIPTQLLAADNISGKKVVYATQDTTASGNTPYTGAGFKPNGAVVLLCEASNSRVSIGVIGSDGVDHCIYFNGTVWGYDDKAARYDDGTNRNVFEWVSWDTDGVTLNLNKEATTPSGTANLIFFFLR